MKIKERAIKEIEIRAILGLPEKTTVFYMTNRENLSSTKVDTPSSRLTKWVEYGLPYIMQNGIRFFKVSDLEKFLKERYQISVEEFNKAFKSMQQENNSLPYTAIYTE